MKTKEFIEKVEALGYKVDDFGTNLIIMDSDGHDFATVSKKQRFVMDTDTFDFATHLNAKVAEKMVTLLFEYSATHIADREEEKRYRLRIVANLGFKDDQRFLNLNIEREEYFICSARQSEWVKTIFTESEISQMDITGFEKVEVME